MSAHVQFNFCNTTTIITGGCSGIGLACSKMILNAGGNVIVTASRNSTKTTIAIEEFHKAIRSYEYNNIPNEIKHKSKEIITTIRPKIFIYPCDDVGNEECVQRLFESIREDSNNTETKRIDYVIHSAGISPNTEFMEQTQKEWDIVLNTNTTGSFLIIKYAALLFKQQEPIIVGHDNIRGKILLVSSTNGINSNDPISAHYDASKAAMNILIRNAAEQLISDGIVINGLAPGWINTEMNATLPDDIRAKESAKIWTKRWATPEEMAIVVMHLLTIPYYVGQILLADGGYR